MSAASARVADKERPLDPVEAARQAGLRHVHDRQPGITRHKRGAGFFYRSPDGRTLRDRTTLLRIRALAVPPAWTAVWICSIPNGHIQATGRDARGRKQYRYHSRFRALREETKYEKIFDFVAALPAIRAQCERDLAKPGLSRDKVLAAVVRLLEETLIRVGNEEYSRLNQSFGLTTLRDRHARIRGAAVQFRFRGKSGKEHLISLTDRRLAKIVKRCRELPGDELFQYLDAGGKQRSIDSADVNEYVRRAAGDDFTAKDFRTWAGTLLAATTLAALSARAAAPRGVRAAKRRINEAIQRTAERLGNTPAICRRCYVHPAVLNAYLAGRTVARIAELGARGRVGLRPDERAVVAFLKREVTKTRAREAPGALIRLLERSVRKAGRSVPRARRLRSGARTPGAPRSRA
jgi:DNA topoisomerase-1